jgi:hypothetical protein
MISEAYSPERIDRGIEQEIELLRASDLESEIGNRSDQDIEEIEVIRNLGSRYRRYPILGSRSGGERRGRLKSVR